MGLRPTSRQLILLLALSLLPQLAHATTVQEVAFVGLRRTSESFLRAVMQTREGQNYDPAVFDRDLRVLRSWEIFRTVDGVATPAPDGTMLVVVSIIERWTLTPIFEFAGTSDVIRLEAGLQDSHFLGRAYQLGGQVGFRQSTYDLDPLGAVWLLAPRVRGSLWLSESRASLDFTHDPLYGQGATAPAMVWQKRLTRVSQSVGYRWHPDWLAGVTGAFDAAQFKAAESFASLSALWGDFVPTKVRLGRTNLFAQWTHLDYHEPNYDGWAMSVVPELSLSGAKAAAFNWRSMQRGYVTVARGWINLAAAMRQEYTTASDWERLRVAGGLSGHVRGYPERYFHAQAILSANAEIRIKLFVAQVLGAQLKPFVDAAYISNAAVGLNRVETRHWARSAGVGIYGWVPQVHLMRLRLDAGWSLEPALRDPRPYLSFDVAHYF